MRKAVVALLLLIPFAGSAQLFKKKEEPKQQLPYIEHSYLHQDISMENLEKWAEEDASRFQTGWEGYGYNKFYYNILDRKKKNEKVSYFDDVYMYYYSTDSVLVKIEVIIGEGSKNLTSDLAQAGFTQIKEDTFQCKFECKHNLTVSDNRLVIVYKE